VYLATSDEFANETGKFFSDRKEDKSSEESYDIKKAKTLWELSEVWTECSK
jgi:hypothetical protein